MTRVKEIFLKILLLFEFLIYFEKLHFYHSDSAVPFSKSLCASSQTKLRLPGQAHLRGMWADIWVHLKRVVKVVQGFYKRGLEWHPIVQIRMKCEWTIFVVITWTRVPLLWSMGFKMLTNWPPLSWKTAEHQMGLLQKGMQLLIHFWMYYSNTCSTITCSLNNMILTLENKQMHWYHEEVSTILEVTFWHTLSSHTCFDS